MKPDLIDLVNEFDEVVGTIDRNKCDIVNMTNIRGVELFLLTKDNKIVTPKRSGNRRIFPNCYDYSAAGMVDAGEDYETAMYRELEEELGFTNIPIKEIAYLNPYKSESKMFIKIYIGYIDREVLNYDKDGIDKILYLTIEEIDEMLESNLKDFKLTYDISFNVLKEYLASKKGE